LTVTVITFGKLTPLQNLYNIGYTVAFGIRVVRLHDVLPSMSISRGRPTVAEVSLGALRCNFQQVRTLVGPRVGILAVVKANGYGHGAVPASRAFVGEGAAALGVATVEEGAELRAAGLRVPILLLGGTVPGQEEDVLDLELTPAVWDLERARALGELAAARNRRLPVHLKIDTGMGRLGVLPDDVTAIGRGLAELPGLEVQGVFSHFACAEDVSGPAVAEQVRLFAVAVEDLAAEGVHPPEIHLANSAAVMTLAGAHASMVRPGIMLYGAPPDPALASRARLTPAMRFRSSVIQVKRVPAGTAVSYGQTFRTGRPSVLATVPVGYADGYPRVLSNRAEVLVQGQRAPVVGRVCMDLTVVDVTGISGVGAGTEVVLWGHQGKAEITCAEVAAWADTIPYELLTGVGMRVPRVYADQ
jgi:alanine racemase